MSIIGEYLNLIPLAVKNREQIVDAIVTKVKNKLGALPQEEQDEIIKRKLICDTCPFNSKNAQEYKTDRVDDHCIHCSCNIDFKTESLMSNCGIETWNLRNPNEKLLLKWRAFKTK